MGPGDPLDLLRPAELSSLPATEEQRSKAGRRRTARAGQPEPGADVFLAGDGGTLAHEQGGPAATGALQQVERAFLGADHGTIRISGNLLGPGMEPNRRR